VASGDLSGLTTITVNSGTLTTTGATLPGARIPAATLTTVPGTVSVTVEENGILVLDSATLADSIIKGELGLVTGAMVYLDGELTIVNQNKIFGAGVIATNSTGSITFESDNNDFKGFTTTSVTFDGTIPFGYQSGGIAGNALATALVALEADYNYRLTNSFGLANAIFKYEPGNAIGTVTLTDNTAVTVGRSSNGSAVGPGVPAVEFDSNVAFVPIGATFTATEVNGSGTTGTSPITNDTGFSFDWDASGGLSVQDTGNLSGPDSKAIVFTFKEYRLANNGLITPETWSVPFSIGVITLR
jgi:hypothetical protein